MRHELQQRARHAGPFAIAARAVPLKFGIMLVVGLMLGACGDANESTATKAQGPTTLSGTVNYPERAPMKLGSSIRVRLEDVSRADAPAMIIAETSMSANGKSVPVPYVLEYEPGRIDERYTYAVRAEIRDAQSRLLWTTTTSHPVLTRGAPTDQVEIMLERVAP